LIGAIIGDIVGSRFEFNNHRSKDFELFTDECFVTDDSIMTLAVAKAIMETCRTFESSVVTSGFSDEFYSVLERNTIRYMQEIGRKYPNCGYGSRFYQWIFSQNPQPYGSFGNGAAMRISPVGFAARSKEEAVKMSKVVTSVSHNHAEGIKGAEATVIAIFMARTGSSKEEIRSRITRDYYELDFTLDEIRDTYEFDETCQGTVPQAIEAFLESTSFEDCHTQCHIYGGDSDTLAAITGGIAEAYYGVPIDMEEKALTYLDPLLRSIYDEWENFIKDF